MKSEKSETKLFTKIRARGCQDSEELQRIFRAVADKARQLKHDEFSAQKQQNPSAVNQLLAQN